MDSIQHHLLGMSLFALLAGCSIITHVEECDDNSDCVLEDGTQYVCSPDNVCIEAPTLGEACLAPNECLDPMICIASADGEDGFCAMECSTQDCASLGDGSSDYVCCELSEGSSACVPSGQCGG